MNAPQFISASANPPGGSYGLPQEDGTLQANATVTAYQAGSPVKSCAADGNGICTLEIGAGVYDLQLTFADNSTVWKNGTVFS